MHPLVSLLPLLSLSGVVGSLPSLAAFAAPSSFASSVPSSVAERCSRTHSSLRSSPGDGRDDGDGCDRRAFVASASAPAAALGIFLFGAPPAARAKCTDIESCREVGERKVEEEMRKNPIVILSDGVRYRVLVPPAAGTAASGGGDPRAVAEGSSVDLAFSISTASGQYMYSRGFGFEKIEGFGGKQESDLGLDSLRVVVGRRDVPAGIDAAIIGMRKGEKRRVELPPGVGFESSDWRPEPTTRRGKVQIEQYQRKLTGFGSQPPFPAETVWDIEVVKFRNN